MCSPPSWNELCGKALPSSSEPTSLPPHLSVLVEEREKARLIYEELFKVQFTLLSSSQSLRLQDALACSVYTVQGMTSSTTHWRLK